MTGAPMYNFQMANRRLTFAHPVGHQEGAIFALDREIHLDGSKYLYNASFGGMNVDVQLGGADLQFTPNVSFSAFRFLGPSRPLILNWAFPLCSSASVHPYLRTTKFRC